MHNDVRDIRTRWGGEVWFATGHGVSRFDGDSWTAFTSVDGLADNSVWGIMQDRGYPRYTWFATEHGIGLLAEIPHRVRAVFPMIAHQH